MPWGIPFSLARPLFQSLQGGHRGCQGGDTLLGVLQTILQLLRGNDALGEAARQPVQTSGGKEVKLCSNP